jgi:hypothetical protein
MLDGIGEGSAKILRVYPHKRLCDKEICTVYTDRSILYRDDNHLSDAGAARIQPELEPIFANGATIGTVSKAD